MGVAVAQVLLVLAKQFPGLPCKAEQWHDSPVLATGWGLIRFEYSLLILTYVHR
jgi:hypothetical protein